MSGGVSFQLIPMLITTDQNEGRLRLQLQLRIIKIRLEMELLPYPLLLLLSKYGVISTNIERREDHILTLLQMQMYGFVGRGGLILWTGETV